MLFDGLDADSESLSHFFLGQAVDPTHDQRFARGFRQKGKEASDLGDLVPEFQLRIRSCLVVSNLEPLEIIAGLDGYDAAAPHMVYDDRCRGPDGILPWMPDSIEGWQRDDARIGLLDHIVDLKVEDMHA